MNHVNMDRKEEVSDGVSKVESETKLGLKWTICSSLPLARRTSDVNTAPGMSIIRTAMVIRHLVPLWNI